MSRLLLALALIGLATGRAEAAPLTMTHSGYLLDSVDHSISSAVVPITFALFNARNPGDLGAQTIWTSDLCNVAVSNGYYSVLLGGSCNSATTPLDTTHLPTGQARYLEVTVGGVTLLPRMLVAAVPTAALATHANESDTVGGEAPAALHDATRLTGAAPTATLQPAIDAARAYTDAQLAAEATSRTAGDSAAIADARLSGNVALLDATSPTFAHVVGAAGFAGDGAGLTNVSASALAAGTAGISVSGSATSFTGGLGGDVIGTQGATTVAQVGGVTAANVAAGANAANASTSANTPGTLVKRDQSGNFTAGTLNLAGLRVGVGTGSPAALLEVADTSAAYPRGILSTQYSDDSLGGVVGLRKARGNATAAAAVQSADVLGAVVFSGHDGSTFVQPAVVRGRAEEAFSATASGTSLEFSTTAPGTTIAAERMRIAGSGNVGIGTANATSLLTLSKDTGTTANPGTTMSNVIAFKTYYTGYDTDTVKAAIGAGFDGASSWNTQNGLLAFSTANAGTLAERLRIDAVGNVGIGTTSPASLLDVNGTFGVHGLSGNSTGGMYFVNATVGNPAETVVLTHTFGSTASPMRLEYWGTISNNWEGGGLAQQTGIVNIGFTARTDTITFAVGSNTVTFRWVLVSGTTYQLRAKITSWPGGALSGSYAGFSGIMMVKGGAG